jgi:hypothetical protein
MVWQSCGVRPGSAVARVGAPDRVAHRRRGDRPGRTGAFEERPDGVLVRTEAAPAPLRGRYPGTGMAGKLLEDRVAERK